MRLANDADFNSASRYLSIKYELYFNGRTEDPFIVTKDDYLIDADWLEEGSADSANPFGSISSGELTFRLHNKDGMFSPTNVASPYYGKICSGLLIIPYIKPVYTSEEVEWTQLGEYYVSGWNAAITGTYADITANDIWYKIFSSASPNYKVERNVTFKQLYDSIFTLMGYNVQVNSNLTRTLLYSFIKGTPQNFLQELARGALTFCTCSKEGQPMIEPFILNRPIRAILSDEDQIKSIDVKQSISKTYEGVELTYTIPQASEVKQLLSMQDISVAEGTSILRNLSFTEGPMSQISSIMILSDTSLVSLEEYQADPWFISLYLLNSNEDPSLISIVINGSTVAFTDTIITDNVDTLLKVSSQYIQDNSYAIIYKNILQSFVSNTIPVLNVSIRGNPLLDIGDRINIISTKYSVNFDGIIQRMQYKYNGSLSCEMTLLNTSILQGVS